MHAALFGHGQDTTGARIIAPGVLDGRGLGAHADTPVAEPSEVAATVRVLVAARSASTWRVDLPRVLETRG